MNNRNKQFKEQCDYWRNNLASGVLRLTERVLLGFNVSDILAGNLEQVKHLEDVSVQVTARRLLQNPVNQVFLEEFENLSSEATIPQYIFVFKNARVDVLTGLVVLDAGFVVDSSLAKWQKIIYRGGIGSSIKRTKQAQYKLAGTYAVLPHSPFYYHIVIDELPNLLRMREDRPDFNNVLVHKLTSRWAIELLEFYKFNVLVLDKKSVIIEELILVSAPRVVVGKNLELLRRNVQSSPNQIVIVSRKGSPRSNNLIEEALQSQIPDSKLIDPSDYPIQQQIEIFSQASVVIGLHGGALTNAVWMDCSGKLIEIFNHAYRTSDYQRLCLELGISYVGIDALKMGVEEIVLAIRTQLNE